MFYNPFIVCIIDKTVIVYTEYYYIYSYRTPVKDFKSLKSFKTLKSYKSFKTLKERNI